MNGRPSRPAHLPSFSIVIETANLAVVGAGEIEKMLGDLATQELSPQCANEVLVIQGTDVPPETIVQIRRVHPWVTVLQSGASTDYFQAKMAGVAAATGELVVLCDSDCRYPSTWLQVMLESFTRRSDIDALTGETGIIITGPLSLATALTWSFPPFSARGGLRRARRVNINAAVYRREVLIRYPYPEGMRVYRGNGVIHIATLLEQGFRIWQEPSARVAHPVPFRDLTTFFWRWLLFGHDLLLTDLWSVRHHRTGRGWQAVGRGALAFLKIVSLASFKPMRRLGKAMRNEPRSLLYLPVAVPIILASAIIAFLGFGFAVVAPGRIVNYAAGQLSAQSPEH